MPSSDNMIFSRALTVGKWTFVSRLLGFVRDALLAFVLGGGILADAFLVAFRLPNMFRRLLAEGSINLAFTPAFVRTEQNEGAERVFTVTRVFFIVTFGFFVLLALGGMLAATPLTLFFAPGFFRQPELLSLTATLVAICLPYVPLAAGAAVFSSLLMARGRYAVPAQTPLVMNIVIIICIGIAVLVATSVGAQAAIVCVGIVLAGVAQCLWQIPALWQEGFRFRGPCPVRDIWPKKMLGRAPLAALGASGYQLNILAATIIASFWSEGSIAALYFAERLIEFPLGVIGTSLGLASLTKFSSLHTPEARQEFGATLVSVLQMALFCSLPAAVGLACLAEPIVSLLFGHGAFDASAQTMTGTVLFAYAIGLPALVLCRPLLSALNALGEQMVPVKGVGSAFVFVLLCGLLCDRAAAGIDRVSLLALCISCAAWGNMVYFYGALSQRGLPLALDWKAVGKTFGASVLVGTSVVGVRALPLPLWGSVFLSVVVGGVTYAIAAGILRSQEAKQILNMVRNRK